MVARIYRPSKGATQAGKGKTDVWILEFEQVLARHIEPLMGWTGARDMIADQIRLEFGTSEEAIRYAKKAGIPYQIITKSDAVFQPKAYADNFAYRRRTPWTH